MTATFSEALAHEITPDLRFFQNLGVAFSTPQDDLGQWNLTLNAPLGLERMFPTDAVGLEVRPSFSFLHPLNSPDIDGYVSLTNGIVARWNHDFSRRWMTEH